MKYKELLQNTLLFFVSILVFLILLEVLLRIFLPKEPERIDPVVFMKSNNSILVYEMKPNAFMLRNGINITINSKGMRDIEYDYGKKKGVYRIAVIGDSVTANVNLNLSSTYTEILERKLNSKGDIFEVLNFGVNGYGTVQELEVLKTKVLKFNPDMVIIGYVLNDPLYSDTIIDFFKQADERKNNICKIQSINLEMPCILRDIFDRLVFIDFLYGKWLNLKGGIEGDFFIRLYNDESEWGTVASSFKEIGKISRRNNIKIVMVIFPVLKDFKGYKWRGIHSKISSEAVKNNFEVVDLLEEYARYHERELKLTRSDFWHPNRIGHQIAAEAIYKKLINSSIIQSHDKKVLLD